MEKALCYIKPLIGETIHEFLTLDELTNLKNHKVVVGHSDWNGTWTTLHDFNENLIQFKDTDPTIWLREVKNNSVGICEMKSFNT